MDVGCRGARLLAAVLVLGLCAPAGAEKPSPCQCSRTSPQTRKNCGFPGITSDQCFKAGCCFDSSVVGVPWCFDPLPKQESEECVMEVSARRDCGYPGISPQECASRKCCFSDVIPQVPWCFFPLPVQGRECTDSELLYCEATVSEGIPDSCCPAAWRLQQSHCVPGWFKSISSSATPPGPGTAWWPRPFYCSSVTIFGCY